MFIEQAMVIGADQKFVGALIVPAFANLRDWAKKQDIPECENDELILQEKVVGFYHSIVESFNANFNHVEQVKRFELLANEWSVDTGEMTPKLSLKRKVVMEKYRDSIERIYSI